MKFPTLCLIASMSLSGGLYANNDFDTVELDEALSQQTLTSLPLLHSLRTQTENRFQVPKIQVIHNSHQVPTLFVEQHDLAMVDIQLTFNAGSARDTEIAAGLYGLANLTAKLLDEGTRRYSAEQISTMFEDLGAKFSVQAQRDMFIIRLRSVSEAEKLDAAIALLLHIIQDAQFQDSGIQLSNRNIAVGQKQLQENPSRLMGIRFYRAIYAKHPYAEPVTGTIASNKKIQTQHLKQFRDQFLVRKNLNLAFTGDLSPSRATQLANRIASGLNIGQKAKALAHPELQQDFEIYHLNSNSTQAHVLMGHLGSIRDNPDRLSLELANRMFGGGGFNSVLMQELRVKRGLTYSAGSSMSFSQAPGVFNLNYSTRADQLYSSLAIAHQSLVNFVKQPLDAAQLEATKSGMLLAFPNQFSSNANINSLLGSMGFYQVSPSYIENYQANLAAIDVKQVEAALKRNIHPDKLTVIIASPSLDKSKVLQDLEQNLKQNSSQKNAS